MAITTALPLQLFKALVEKANDAILVTEASPLARPGPRIVYANQAFSRLSGHAVGAVLGRTPRILQGPLTDHATLRRISQSLAQGQAVREEILNYHKNGSPYWLDIHIVPLVGAGGEAEFFAAIERDITDRKQMSEHFQRLASQDSLTGLANRAGFDQRLAACLAGPTGSAQALLLIDLDRFKLINDLYGHPAGDEVLRRFAESLRLTLATRHYAARLGGDEFAVLVDAPTGMREALDLGWRIVAMARALSIPSIGVGECLGASVGVAMTGQHRCAADLVAAADTALYAAKRDGRGVARLFEGEMHRGDPAAAA